MSKVPLEVTMMKRIGELNKENAHLKAEVDNLRKNTEINTAQSTHELSRLKAEVERLTKAGDAMDAYLKRQDGTTNGMLDCRYQWNAAKEGETK